MRVDIPAAVASSAVWVSIDQRRSVAAHVYLQRRGLVVTCAAEIR